MTEKMRNILRGAGSLISVNTPNMRRTIESQYRPASSPMEALRSDMKRIGGDLKTAIGKTTNGEK